MNESDRIRFLGYVDVVYFDLNGVTWVCEEWQGKRDHNGYGRFWYRGSWRQAHRHAYMYLSDSFEVLDEEREIPEDLPQLNHLCNNRACVKPSHLQPCTMKQNHEYRSQIYFARKERMNIQGGFPDGSNDR
jgi:hypothetical protein